MRTLFIDTSSKDVSIATFNGNELLYSLCREIPNMHSIYTVPYIKECLDNSKLDANDIDRVMVINGPGSFTGIRIGLTIAKVYSYLLKLKTVTISSLKALALSTEGETIISLLDARNDNYYVGVYDKNYNSLIDEQFVDKNQLLELFTKYDNTTLVSYEHFCVDNYEVNSAKLNLEKINDYYINYNGVDNFSVKTNYLKLPQVLEDKK